MKHILLCCIVISFLFSIGYSYPLETNNTGLTLSQSNTSNNLTCHTDYDCPTNSKCTQSVTYQDSGTCACSNYYMSINDGFCNYAQKDGTAVFLLNFFLILWIPAGSLYATSGIPNLDNYSTKMTLAQLLTSGLVGMILYAIIIWLITAICKSISNMCKSNNLNNDPVNIEMQDIAASPNVNSCEITQFNLNNESAKEKDDTLSIFSDQTLECIKGWSCGLAGTMSFCWWIYNFVIYVNYNFTDENGYPLK